MKRDRHTALYVISVAAELAGVHPQTLRIYERKGLLDPARTPGGARRYSDADLERLRHIGELTDAGVSLEGVRRILELERQLRASAPTSSAPERAWPRRNAVDAAPAGESWCRTGPSRSGRSRSARLPARQRRSDRYERRHETRRLTRDGECVRSRPLDDQDPRGFGAARAPQPVAVLPGDG